MRQFTVIGGFIAIVLAVIVIVFITRGNGASSPAAEVAFINGMQPIMAQVQNPAGANLDDWRQKRAAMICNTVTGLQVTDWIGTVDKVDTSISGGAILSVAVMPNVDFGTAPNALSNLSSNTLIAQGSALYQTIAALQVGQKIRFSGQLFSSSDDCIQEASVTTAGSMQNPLFVTRFVSITPLPHTDD
jgi:hypothetical protein